MKSRLFLSTLILVGMVLACLSTRARTTLCVSTVKDSIPIVLKGDETVIDPNYPRSPVLDIITCSFDNTTGNLYFTFFYSLGDVTITLTEAIAGVVSSDEYSSSLGQAIVPVPGPGTYEISVLLASGEEYVGQFVN